MKLIVRDPSARLDTEITGLSWYQDEGVFQGVRESGELVTVFGGTGAGFTFNYIGADESGPVNIYRNGLTEATMASSVEIILTQISPELYATMTGQPIPEGTDEMTSHITTARADLDAARAAVERAERSLQAAESKLYPKEPAAANSIVRFKRMPRGSYSSYDYAAIKAGARWYPTGSTCPARGFSWKELIDWIRDGMEWSPLQVMVATGGDKLRVVKL